jgi:2-dehydro-3-deoxygalactonokinase
MAGSRQGWTEARYVDVPAALDTVTQNAVRVAGTARDVRILPGIAQRDVSAPEVMRGEETQLLGALAPGAARALACLPGSHSKWVRVENDAVTAFATFLTGELYAAIGRHTILSQALREGGFEASAGGAYGRAVRAVLDHPAGFSNGLFSIRSGQLLGYAERDEGAARLSGYLIGSELAGARSFWAGASRVTLIAGHALAGPYATALGIAGLDVDLIEAEEAVRRGLFAAARAIWPAHEAITEAE